MTILLLGRRDYYTFAEKRVDKNNTDCVTKIIPIV